MLGNENVYSRFNMRWPHAPSVNREAVESERTHHGTRIVQSEAMQLTCQQLWPQRRISLLLC